MHTGNFKLKYHAKNCKHMQEYAGICSGAYFAYLAYICTPHFQVADDDDGKSSVTGTGTFIYRAARRARALGLMTVLSLARARWGVTAASPTIWKVGRRYITPAHRSFVRFNTHPKQRV